jgi:hypothetical protein
MYPASSGEWRLTPKLPLLIINKRELRIKADLIRGGKDHEIKYQKSD